MSSRWWPRWPVLVWFSLVATGLVVWVFSPFILQGRSIFIRDIYNFHYPLWVATAKAFHQAGVPAWNALINFGQNAAGNPNYLLFYPPAWLRFVMNPLTAMNLFVLLHLLAGGILFYCLCRRWGLSEPTAFWGGLFFAFCGLTLSVLAMLNLVPYLVIAPLMMIAVERILSRPDARAVGFSGLVIALMFTVFEPVMVFGLLLLVVGRLVAGVRAFHGQGRLRRGLVVLMASLVIGLLAAAPVIAEGVRLLTHSQRQSDNTTIEELYTQPVLFTHAFWVPNPFGLRFTLRGGFRGDIFSLGQKPYFFSLFLGFGTVFLMGAALAGAQRRRAGVILGVALGFLILAWGPQVPLLGAVLWKVPPLEWARYTQKFAFFASAAFLVLALLGLEDLFSRKPVDRPAMMWPLVIGTTVAIAVLIMGRMVPGSSLESLLPVSLPAGIAVAVLLALRRTGPAGRWIGWGVGALILVELLAGNTFLVPFTQRRLLEDRVPVLDAIKTDAGKEGIGNFRVVVEGEPADLDVQAPTDSIVWYYHFYRRAGYPYPGFSTGTRYACDPVFDRLETPESAQLRATFITLSLERRLTLMEKMGVRYLISPREYRVSGLELLGWYPTGSNYPYALYRVAANPVRIAFVDRFAFVTDRINPVGQLLARPDGEVLITPTDEMPVMPLNRTPRTGSPELRVLSDQSDRLQIRIHSDRPGFIVVRDTFYPGWGAGVDGQATPVLKADFFFRAVYVPGGEHEVSMVYRPAGGPLLRLVALLALLAVLVSLAGPGLPALKNHLRRRARRPEIDAE